MTQSPFSAATPLTLVPTLPGYQVGALLQAGTRLLLYRGHRTRDEAPVIIQLPCTERPSFTELLQLRNHYTITRELRLQGVAPPLAFERCHNGFAIIMEDRGHVPLNDYRAAHPLSVSQVLELGISLAETLEGLYQQRVIHKDLKPSNILIHPETRDIQLMNFSIASRLPRETQTLKNLELLEGTLAYMSPEQTGRMNRGIDYRTDFYSLGVTLYELLTDRLPFQTTDPLELAHCHIARPPRPPRELNPAIPEMVERIVLKLMAKAAEARYASAHGLRHDLRTCLEALLEQKPIPSFELARRDVSDRFHLPEKLYGRQEESRTLLNAFERVCQGGMELLMVAGFSGIGKTTVVNEIHRPVVRAKGFFVSGKFDQLGRSIPYSALVQALSSLVRQLQVESGERLETWRQRLQVALGGEGRVLVDVLPELEGLIGPQPEVTELAPAAAQQRFNLLFTRLLRAFATQEHPLVIFLDDLQWADSASLKMLHLLATELGSARLLLIGAYRDNEVTPAHPLMLTLEEIRNAGVRVHPMTLAPLPEHVVNELVAETLSCPPERARPLTGLVYQKTGGNPFFTSQYLKSLFQRGLVSYDASAHMWQCDLAQVRAQSLSSDVVEFMAGQLQRLPEETRKVLELAACIGNRFELATLSRVYGCPEAETAAALWCALQEGLILPTSEVYKFYQDLAGLDAAGMEPLSARYRFLHDRVQQAAHSLIPESDRQRTHLEIGRRLLETASVREREEHLFDIVNHLNVARGLLVEVEERHELAQANLRAGRKALASNAYEVAREYLEMGLTLLEPASWRTHYELTLALHEEAASAAWLSKRFARQEELVDAVLSQARTVLERVRAYEIRIQTAIAQERLAFALETGLHVLRDLGVEFPAAPRSEDIERGREEVRAAVGDGSLEQLISLPEMTDARCLAEIRILTLLAPPAYQTKPALLQLLIFRTIVLTARHGVAPISASTFAMYGLVLCGMFDELDKGFQSGQLALKILERFNVREPRAKTLYVVNVKTLHWKRHVRESLKPLLDAYASGLETGDLEFMGWSADFYCHHSFLLGRPLGPLVEEMDEYRKVLEHHHRRVTLRQYAVYQQAVLNLSGEGETPWRLVGRAWNEDELLPRYVADDDGTASCIAYVNKLMLAYLFGQYRLAVECADAAEKYLPAVAAQFLVPRYYFFDSLARLALLPELGEEERSTTLERIAANQRRMERWARSAPMNFLHPYHLVEAERCRVRGARAEALEHYDRAIALAREHEHPHDEALAHELTARFFLEWGMEHRARPHLHEAHEAHSRWGAHAMLRHLSARYREQGLPVRPAGDPEARAPDETRTGLDLLDLQSVLESSRVFFSEMNLERLLERVVVILCENAGAQRCVLLREERQHLSVVMEHTALTGETRRHSSDTPADAEHVPASVIRRSIRTQQPIVLQDLSRDDSLADDPYVHRHAPRSVLSLPIFHQGRLLIVVYLENNLAPGVFTSRHLQTLTLLASQIALSLENAALYGDLEQRVQERTSALEAAHKQLVEVAHRAGMAEIASGVLHNIGNSLTSLVVTTESLARDVARLPVEQLKKSARLLAGKDEEFSGFLEKDSRGRMLPEYLDKLGDKLRSDADNMLGELRSMKTNLEQIGATIHVQQVYAHGPRLVEQVDVDALVEDALRMHQSSLSRHQVLIERDMERLPVASLERHKVLHILVNLISNAKQALMEAQQADKRIRIEARPCPPGRFLLMVRDNGVGIAAEDLQRIFQFGFTTRPGSLGYGLHWAANTAREMGGSLVVASEGRGRGACFTLELPLSGRVPSEPVRQD
ncbi:AAA family ATPase [Archangium violaceum]|uniref:trifunctional serine/threonine-protein kinase/ATP-binding protein/sensor histidine kinase n=1 Tax=Archangium violaceum TaxID=83451 RepID=UPI001951B6ED|nr:trifunctional serine/threonine-protein kinase/ATP-binding protein/sensor histidine kinase [Archangium violaceum]QRO01247.1 AAA family ATPase [Archangium violaceum]